MANHKGDRSLDRAIEAGMPPSDCPSCYYRPKIIGKRCAKGRKVPRKIGCLQYMGW